MRSYNIDTDEWESKKGMKRILIIGSKGNMGRRYAAICAFLKIPFQGIDVGDYFDPNDYSNYIIATPTETHIETIKFIIQNASKYKVRILCEKPIAIVSNVLEGLSVIRDANFAGHEVFMVNQYAYYPKLNAKRDLTYYNFYNTGKDSLKWDCIQLIHLARGEVVLDKTSPVWECKINGTWLDRETLDECYVDMVEDFYKNTKKKLWGWEDIFKAHLKVVQYEENPNRDSSKV